MILAYHQSLKMLKQKGRLRASEEMLCMYPISHRQLMIKLALYSANLTLEQIQALKLFQFRAFLCDKIFDRKSWQSYQMKIPVKVLRHFMSMGIPRQMMIRPIINPRVSRYEYMQNFFKSIPLNSRILDLFGDHYYVNFRSEDNLRVNHIKMNTAHMTRHPNEKFWSMICGRGNVWIQKSDDPNNLFYLIHDAKNDQSEHAFTCEFSPSKLIIAIGFFISIKIIEFSPSLNAFNLKKKIAFDVKPNLYSINFLVNQIQWHPSGTCFTAISSSGSSRLAKSFLLNERFDLRDQGNCAYTWSLSTGTIAPSCLCFSPDGNFAVTGNSNGLLTFWKVINQGNELTFEILKSECVLAKGCQIKKIQFFPQCESIFAIQLSSGRSSESNDDDVYILKISQLFDVEILQKINHLSHFDFYGDFLMIQGRNVIIYMINSDNLPVKMTEFELEDRPIRSSLLITENGKVMLYYSYVGRLDLHKAALEFK